MKKVFVGGSRGISRINDVIRERLDAMIGARLRVLIGDASGADKAAQKHFAERDYRDVTVFFSGSEFRNNLADWPTRQVQPISQKKDFSYYAAKDLAMSEEADYGFMLWDGESRGTLNNVLNLLERGKKVVVYFAPEQRCHTLASTADLKVLLEMCSTEALDAFENKVDLEARLINGQLNLG